ncbi:MAG: ABC transporter permease subunit [Candidatus Tokpelaia sp.]|nr:MAG: ABC transporter permease subunit [Candidatus Tokpelaia sp.]KAA6207175.1 MAG: ABC transporter permease subunit [Candidatus Tokpelaia sp.]
MGRGSIMDIFSAWGRQLAAAALLTVEIALLSLIFGLIWGLLVAWAKASSHYILRKAADIYVSALRGIPELLVIFIIFYGGAVTLTALNARLFGGSYVEIPAYLAGAFALSLVFGAYAAENIRGALLAMPRGQIEAGEAIGLSRRAVFYYIRLPFLWRYALPGLANNWLSLLKDTSLVSIIGLQEIMGTTDIAVAFTHKPFSFYAMAAAIYLFLTLVNLVGIRLLEKRLSHYERRAA